MRRSIEVMVSEETLKEARRLVKRQVDEFQRHVAKESDLTIILLRGHLLIEYYLSMLLLLEYDKQENVDRLSFFAKLKKLEEAKSIILEKYTFRALFRLNDLRNQIAHNLEFKISDSNIDSIGFCIGKEYVLEKYSDDKESNSLLIWTIEQIMMDLFYPLYVAVANKKTPASKPVEKG